MAIKLSVDGKVYEVEVSTGLVTVDGQPYGVKVESAGRLVTVTVDGASYKVEIKRDAEGSLATLVDGQAHRVSVLSRSLGRIAPPPPKSVPIGKTKSSPESGALGTVRAIMPGKILSVWVKEGDQVKVGKVLLILEAMKMENEIRSPVDGMVQEVLVTEGVSVNGGDILVIIG